MPGGPELIIILIVIVVLFGASRLPAMGRNLGVGIKEFKKGIGEATRDGKDKGEADRLPEPDERDRGPSA
jgi:sec-independent protein translocase protein TatA